MTGRVARAEVRMGGPFNSDVQAMPARLNEGFLVCADPNHSESVST